MSIFKTRTPNYRGGAPGRPDTTQTTLLDWLGSLFRTPTPEYATKSVSTSSRKSKKE